MNREGNKNQSYAGHEFCKSYLKTSMDPDEDNKSCKLFKASVSIMFFLWLVIKFYPLFLENN